MTYERLYCLIAGFNDGRHSGRGMSDQECLSVMMTGQSPLEFLADIVEQCADENEAAELLRTARTNNLGLKTIIYWPSVKVPA